MCKSFVELPIICTQINLYLFICLKAGVGILEDSNKLLVDHNLDLVGCLDLRHLAVREGSIPGKLGLQSLAHFYLDVMLDKVSSY